MSSEGAGPVLAVVAADRLPVSEASLCPGSLSALVGVHPELGIRFTQRELMKIHHRDPVTI